MVRRVSATYRETRSTLVAGYMPSTSFFGHDRNLSPRDMTLSLVVNQDLNWVMALMPPSVMRG